MATQDGAKRKPLRTVGWVLWALVAVGVVIGLWQLAAQRSPAAASLPEAAPIYGTLPRFQLLDERGQPFGSEQLQGRIYVADFIFTRCRSLCPLITKRMAQLQQRLVAEQLDAALVSFSVDPQHDTPERLKAYAEQAGADPERWRFVTGPVEAMYALVVQGFGTSIDRQPESAPASQPSSAPSAAALSEQMIDISHSSRFAVVDRGGRVRGYFESNSAGIEETLARVRQLLAETGGAG